MAKKHGKKRSSRRFFGVRARRTRRSSSGSASFQKLAVGALIYGIGRQQIAQAIQPFTSKIPLGNIADEVGMIALAFAAKKFVKNPMVAQVANAAITIEMAQIGQALASGQLGNLGVKTESTAAWA